MEPAIPTLDPRTIEQPTVLEVLELHSRYRNQLPPPDFQEAWLLEVDGTPRPQGSKRAFVNPKTGRAMMTESSGANHKQWRQAVKEIAVEHRPDVPIAGPVLVGGVFRFRRPKAHYGTGRNERVLKPSAPLWVTSKAFGDIDKLLRTVLDALAEAQFVRDDCVVAGTLQSAKVWVDLHTGREGASLYVVRVGDVVE